MSSTPSRQQQPDAADRESGCANAPSLKPQSSHVRGPVGIAGLLLFGMLATALAIASHLHAVPFDTVTQRPARVSATVALNAGDSTAADAKAATRSPALPGLATDDATLLQHTQPGLRTSHPLMRIDERSVVRRGVVPDFAFDGTQTIPGPHPRIAMHAQQAKPVAAAAAPAVQSAHPRLLLDSDTLTRLRAAAANDTTEWQALKSECDAYIGGTVNYPTGDQYPDKPNLGSGYQGEVYLPVMLDEAMCYQVLKTSQPSTAATYGAKAVDILLKMSTPYSTASGNQGWNPCHDDGYGIRNYGVGFGIGYDWLYELLNASQRSQVYTTANAWLTAWEKPGGCADFVYEHPLSNYYAGYFHAKAVIAMATLGDNPSAPAEWDDWYNNQYAQRVQPYYAKHLGGGGWLEGFANYGPSAIRNMTLPMREVKTATGIDLVHASAPFSYPLDSAQYAMHFTWPSRKYFDDRDTNHANGVADPPPGTAPFGMFQQLLGALVQWNSPDVAVFHQYFDEVGTATSNYWPEAEWLVFLDAYPDLPSQSVNALPLSYLATGIGAVAARSDWSTGASWMSFRAAPYIENPDQGEEGFDQGSLALARGNTPLLVNTFGWMVHEPNGSADENLLYDDLFAGFDNTQYHGNRQIYNVFYVRRMSGNTVQERFGQAAYTAEDDGVTTRVSAFEDGGDYVYVQADNLEDMYRTFSAGPAVAGWSRQIVYLRPNRFIVYDRTTAGSAAYDQYMAWHFPANPASATAPTGQNRIDVHYAGQFAGAMTTVLPANVSLKTVPLYPASNPTKVWQVQARPTDTAASQHWLTVFDLSSSASAVAAATQVNVTQGNMVGVRLTSGTDVSVVLESAAAAGATVSGTIVYSVPAATAHHVITELAPGSGYNIRVASAGGNQMISVSPGGAWLASANGVLDFNVSAGGAVGLTSKVPPRCDPPMPAYPVSK